MDHRIVRAFAALTLLAACGRDKEPEAVPVQQPADTAPAPAAPSQGAAPAAGSATGAKAPSTGSASRPGAGAESAAAAELARAPQVYTVQVAALTNPTQARWWVAELQRQGVPAYFTTTMVNGEEVSRLRIGATLTPGEARSVAQRIQSRYSWPVWITTVPDRSVLPPNALPATRAYAGGQ
jgi:cell division septation protein DedD